jgi:hypothetical protein
MFYMNFTKKNYHNRSYHIFKYTLSHVIIVTIQVFVCYSSQKKKNCGEHDIMMCINVMIYTLN